MPTAEHGVPTVVAARVLLDTHVLLWWKADRNRLSATAAAHLSTTSEILLSPVTFWEVAMLIGKGRVKLDRPTRVWVQDVLAPAGVELAELTAATAVAAAELVGFHGDPADRFIVATAESLRVPLVTKDRMIHTFAAGRSDLTAIW